MLSDGLLRKASDSQTSTLHSFIAFRDCIELRVCTVLWHRVVAMANAECPAASGVTAASAGAIHFCTPNNFERVEAAAPL